MSFAERHNKTKQFTNVPDYGDKPTFKSLKELFEENGADAKYKFHGFYINKKGNFGDSPAAYLDACICNFPGFMLDECLEFTTEDVNDINEGKVGFMIEQFEKQLKNGTKLCHGVKWIDM